MFFLGCLLFISGDWTSPQTEIFKFISIHAFHIDDQAIFVMDRDECKVMVFNHSGNLTHKIGEKGQGPGQLPQLLKFYVRGEKVYLVGLRHIQVFERGGQFLRRFIKPGEIKMLTKTHLGWLGVHGLPSYQRAMADTLTWVAMDDDLQNERVIYSWDNAPKQISQNHFDKPGFNPVREFHMTYQSHTGRYGLLKFAGLNRLFISDSQNQFIVKTLDIKGSPKPFDDAWGKAMLKFINQRNPTVQTTADFPTVFPLIENILISWDDRLVLWKWKANPPTIEEIKEGNYFPPMPEVYSLDGRPLKPRAIDRFASRIVGKKDAWFYIIIQDTDGAYTLERALLNDIEKVIKNNPIKL